MILGGKPTIFGNIHVNLRGFFAYDWVDESHPYHRIDPPTDGPPESLLVLVLRKLALWLLESPSWKHLLGCGGVKKPPDLKSLLLYTIRKTVDIDVYIYIHHNYISPSICIIHYHTTYLSCIIVVIIKDH